MLLVALAAPWMAGCSAIKLSYNNAPEITYWWLDGYLDFDGTQARRLRADLVTLQAWHRQIELPRYITVLEKLQFMATSSVSPTQVCTLFDEIRPRMWGLFEQAVPTAVALAPTLTGSQLEKLTRQFDQQNDKWREKWLNSTPAQRSTQRLKLATDRAEHFYGPLQEAQIATLHASVATSAFDAKLSYREIQRRQQDTLQTLRQLMGSGWDDQHATTAMRTLLERTRDSPESDYQSYSNQLVLENCRTIASLHNSTTPNQRRHLMNTLKDLEYDARSLMTPNL